MIEGISGTSAGAMNAAVLCDGFVRAGPQGARAAMEDFWRQVAEAARWSPLQRTPGSAHGALDPGSITGLHRLRACRAHDLALRHESLRLSPPARHPGPVHRRQAPGGLPIKLFITATKVSTGRGRVFRNADICPEVLLASACLPTLFQAIEIEGEAYWDGGYAGNPTITPLVRESNAHDTILVQINPVERQDTPRNASEIHNRLNEVAFNAPLLKELRMIALLRQVADPGQSEGHAGRRCACTEFPAP